MDEENPQKQPVKISDPSTVLFLGLYLILLAFFILLSSVSTVSESKTSAAVGSINSAFRSDTRVEALTGDSLLLARGAGQLDRALLGAVRASFSSAFPNVEPNETIVGRAVRFVIPSDSIFPPGRSAIHAEAGDLVAKLARSLETSALGFRNDVEVVLRTGEKMPSASDPEGGLMIERAGTMARELLAKGVHERSIKTGLRGGPPGTIAFFFRQTDETAPVLSFEGEAIFQSNQ
jgi:hypothetical protein